MTPDTRVGSHFVGAALLVIFTSCGTRGEAHPASHEPARDPSGPAAPAAPPQKAERCLGVADKGIFADLDGEVQLALPAGLDAARVTATIDRTHAVVVLAIDGYPRKAYPLGGPASLTVG